MTTIKRVNATLKRAGRVERLVRNPVGYYYLINGVEQGVECSIYAFHLDENDYDFAIAEVNDALKRAGQATI